MPPSGGEMGILSSYSGHSVPPSGGEKGILSTLEHTYFKTVCGKLLQLYLGKLIQL